MRDWLSYRAGIEPKREALVDTTTAASYTFGTLDTLVDDLAGRLAAVGVEPGTHLGAVLPPRVEHVCLIHAAMRLGVTLVPMGDGLTARELAAGIDAADVDTVVCGAPTEDAVTDAVDALDGRAGGDGADPVAVTTVDDPAVDDVAPLSAAEADPVPSPSWSLDDTQVILFTSGTTGDPKPVRLTTGNLLASAAASAFRLGFDPDDRWLATLPLHHAGGVSPILRMPIYGMTVVLRAGFDAGETADDLGEYGATAVSVVPTMLRRMLDRRGTLAESLRVVLLGGAPASTELIERCRNYSVPVVPTYGTTETASQIATARPGQAFENPGSVGNPLFLTEVRIVNEAGDPLPAGESGEIVVDGPTVTPGYYGTPAATEAAFGEFGLHTGDVGVMSEAGTLTVLNRLDDRILTGGETVDPGAVTEVLVAHHDVAEAAVVGVSDPEWGERVSALLVPAPGVTDPGADPESTPDRRLDPDDVLAFARERLAAYKLPKSIAIAESLPRTVSGTVDRAAVRDRFTGDGSGTGGGDGDSGGSEGSGDDAGGGESDAEDGDDGDGEPAAGDDGNSDAGDEEPAAGDDGDGTGGDAADTGDDDGE